MAYANSTRVNKIFDDLDGYREFCRDYGYSFNEIDLYDNKSFVYRQYQKFLTGKPVKDQWEIDAAKFKAQAEAKKVSR